MKHDFFLALPGASDGVFVQTIKDIVARVNESTSTRVFCAALEKQGEHVCRPSAAYKQRIEAVKDSAHFILLAPTEVDKNASYCEMGYADGLGLPMTIIRKSDAELPWMIKQLGSGICLENKRVEHHEVANTQNMFEKLEQTLRSTALKTAACLTPVNEMQYDYFIAVPMSSLDQQEYVVFKSKLRKLKETLEQSGKSVFCAPITAETPNFKEPAIAYALDIKAIINSKRFVLLMPSQANKSSVFYEAGFALARRKPTTIISRDQNFLPWMLQDDGESKLGINYLNLDGEIALSDVFSRLPDFKRLHGPTNFPTTRFQPA